MLHSRRITTTVLVLAFAAPPVAVAMPGTELTGDYGDDAAAPVVKQDLRSPDARDAAVTSSLAGTSNATQDLRSPDARDAASSSVVGTGAVQDLRSPDARDAATLNVRPTEPVPAVETPSADGFEWGHAAIGAAAMLAIVLGIGGTAALVSSRRHARMPQAPLQ